jgi:hypothetical protein
MQHVWVQWLRSICDTALCHFLGFWQWCDIPVETAASVECSDGWTFNNWGPICRRMGWVLAANQVRHSINMLMSCHVMSVQPKAGHDSGHRLWSSWQLCICDYFSLLVCKVTCPLPTMFCVQDRISEVVRAQLLCPVSLFLVSNKPFVTEWIFIKKVFLIPKVVNLTGFGQCKREKYKRSFNSLPQWINPIGGTKIFGGWGLWFSFHFNVERWIHPMGADKSLAFPISCFPICSTTRRISLDVLKKLEQQSHKCVELRGEYVG